MSESGPPARFPAGFELRPMRADDLSQVLKVERACYSSPWSRQIFEAELENEFSQPTVLWRVADEQEVVGHLVYWIVHDELHLLNIAVRPSYQRRGLASAMLVHLFAVADHEKLLYVALEVREHNFGAQQLYRRHGFEEVGRRPRYYPDTGEAAIVMAVVTEEPKAD